METKVCSRCQKDSTEVKIRGDRTYCEDCRYGKSLAEQSPEKTTEAVKKTLMHAGRRLSLEEICDLLDLAPVKVRGALDELGRQHFEFDIHDQGIQIATQIPRPEPIVIDTSRMVGKRFHFGATGDNHLGSKYERLDVLNALFDRWQDKGIDTVLQCGNMIDGEARFNKFDLKVHGVEAQVEYFLEHWPQRPGMRTLFVTGDDHEGWYTQREGLNVGRMIQERAVSQGRHDLVFMGHMEADLQFTTANGQYAVMRLIHGGGGTAYAISYKDQKIVESYQGGEKPQILLVGHFHKFNYGYPREVHSVQVGCTQDQTPFMRKNHIQAMIGGVRLHFEQSEDGLIHDFGVHFDPFYDRSFYQSNVWKYEWPNIGRRA